VPINELEEITDDFFVSDFDLIETLRNLSTPAPFVLISQTPS
jgi:hypothetical protein